jgi:hypothetical protein
MTMDMHSSLPGLPITGRPVPAHSVVNAAANLLYERTLPSKPFRQGYVGVPYVEEAGHVGVVLRRLGERKPPFV